jgi:hypothetical protein
MVPLWALLLGTILPDLIDKPLYHGLAFFIGHDEARQTIVSGTRTFGHTALFLGVIVAIAYFRNSPVWRAIALGVATHLLIDNIGDNIPLSTELLSPSSPSGLHALCWPLLGWTFPVYPLAFRTSLSHLSTLRDPWIIGGEIVGFCFLAWDLIARRRKAVTGEKP